MATESSAEQHEFVSGDYSGENEEAIPNDERTASPIETLKTQYLAHLRNDFEKLKQLRMHHDREPFIKIRSNFGCEALNAEQSADLSNAEPSAGSKNPNIEDNSLPSVAASRAKLEAISSFSDGYSSSTVPRKKLDPKNRHITLRESMYTPSAGIVCKGNVRPDNDDNNDTMKNDSNNIIANVDNIATNVDVARMKANKKIAKLVQILQEFVDSESRFVKRLATLCEDFQECVISFNRSADPYQYISLDLFFVDINKIFKFHRDKLLPGFNECLQYHVNKGPEKRLMGQLFVDLEMEFKVYEDYPEQYKGCIDALDKKMSEVFQFKQLVTDFEKLEACEGLKLKYFYIEPIQRLPRYELLLKEYTSCLADESEDLVNAHIALNLIKQLNISWNAKIKEQENYFKLKEIEYKIVDSIDLTSVTREMVKEGAVDVIQPTLGRVEERFLFLFSDMLLICQISPHIFRPPYYIVNRLNVDHLQFKTNRNKIYLFSPQAVVEIQPRTSDDLQGWLKAFKQTLNVGNGGPSFTRSTSSISNNFNDRRLSEVPDTPQTSTSLFMTSPSFQYPADDANKRSSYLSKSSTIRTLGSVAPMMVKEQDVLYCMECGDEFTFFNRKQWCHCCGRVVCKSCSLKKEALPYAGLQIKRVCNSCYDVLRKTTSLVPKMFT